MNKLLTEVGPNGNVVAHVEDDGRVVYLYLRGTTEDGLSFRPIWVRNRVRAPAELDVECMRRGEPPLVPAAHCRQPGGSPELHADRLRLIWLPEGTAWHSPRERS